MKKTEKKGYIIIQNRKGEKMKFSFISIAIAAVTNIQREITHPAQVSTIATELKKFLKQQGRSAFVVDRRKE